MSFIKKIREIDPKQIMLISLGLGLVGLYSFFHAWTSKTTAVMNQQEIFIPKIEHPVPVVPQYPGWQTVLSQSGDDIALLFNRAGLTQQTLQQVLINNPYAKQLQQIKADEIYYFKIEQEQLVEMVHALDKKQFLRVLHQQQHFTTTLQHGHATDALLKPTVIEQQAPVIQTKWLSIHPRPGDTLGKVFHRAGLSQKTLMMILHRNSHQKELARIHPKLAIHFQIENHQLQTLIFPIHAQKYLYIQHVGQHYQTLVRLGRPNIPKTTSKAITTPIAKPRLITPAQVPVATQMPPQEGWVSIHPVRGDTLSRIFNRAGLTQTDLQQVLAKNPYARQLSRINLNDDIRFKIQNHQLIEMQYNLDLTRYLLIQKHGPIYQTKVENRPMVEKREYVSLPVKGSLYQTAKSAGIPLKLIDQINQIFFWQVQLSREIRAGDRLNLVYQTYYVNGKKAKIGDVLAVSYKHANGVKYEAIRHQSRHGQVTYYQPNGASLKKAFSRYPIRFSHISSNFGSSRKHPILHYRRPHKGIDLAAPIGTPIYAIGDGKIAFIGRQNGYGNMIKINHAYSYTTVYAHMLRFQKGLKNGSYVQKGQIIGFVGQSGLATGPHCHYELHLNHIPRNPTSVALPQAQPVPRPESLAFQRFTREIMAQLHLYEATKLASKNQTAYR